MTVSMLDGSAMVSVGENSGFVPTGSQINVPLDEQGMANNAPGQATVIDPRVKAISDAVEQYGLDTRTRIIMHAVDQYQLPAEIVNYFLYRFQRAIDKCTKGQDPDPRYVYNAMYYYNKLKHLATQASFQEAMGDNLLKEMNQNAQSCLSFELDFNSTIQVDAEDLNYQVRLRSEKVKVVFNLDGSLAVLDSKPLTHLVYQVTVPDAPGCSRADIATDGSLTIKDGSLKIDNNVMDVTLDMDANVPEENLQYTCSGIVKSVPVTWKDSVLVCHAGNHARKRDP